MDVAQQGGEKSKNGGRGKKEKKEAKKPKEKGLLLCLGMDGWTGREQTGQGVRRPLGLGLLLWGPAC